MRAIHVAQPGGPEALVVTERPAPRAAPNQVLMQVHATALNRADLLQRAGKYPPPSGESEILGLEAAGVVGEVGSDVEGWEVGDRVFALLAGGGYADYVNVPADLLMAIPERLSFEEAAAVPEVFLTAFQSLVTIADLRSEETVLVHAGGSGVGTAAIQIGRLKNCRVFVTASSGKHQLCLQLGASRAIDYRLQAFDDTVLSETAGNGANVILDFLGASYFEKNVRAAAIDGRIVLLALMGGHRLDGLDMRPLFRKRLSVFASTLRSRSINYKVQLTRRFEAEVLPLFSDGTLAPVVDSVFALEDVRAAHERMEANLNAGKIVLKVR